MLSVRKNSLLKMSQGQNLVSEACPQSLLQDGLDQEFNALTCTVRYSLTCEEGFYPAPNLEESFLQIWRSDNEPLDSADLILSEPDEYGQVTLFAESFMSIDEQTPKRLELRGRIYQEGQEYQQNLSQGVLEPTCKKRFQCSLSDHTSDPFQTADASTSSPGAKTGTASTTLTSRDFPPICTRV